jgi:hypothetical protein
MGGFDQRTLAQAFSFPGIDPRIWTMYATVDHPTEGEGGQVIEFDEADGQPYLNCTIQPTGTPIRARVGMMNSGPGEGVWFPFVGGEEVLISVPNGNARSGCVVLARLPNAYDTFPTTSVGGVDPALNSASFIRSRPMMIIESGASAMLRSAPTGAMVLLSAQGNVTLRDGGANVLQMGPGVLGWQSKDGASILQMDVTNSRYYMQIGSGVVSISGSATGLPSLVQSPTPLKVAAGGIGASGAKYHVATVEAVANILDKALTAVSAAIGVAVGLPPVAIPLTPILTAAATSDTPTSATAPINTWTATGNTSVAGLGDPHFLAG